MREPDDRRSIAFDSFADVPVSWRWALNASTLFWIRRDIRGDLLVLFAGRRWQAGHFRAGCGLVLLLHRNPDLMAVDGDLARRLDAEPDCRAGDLEHRDGDVVSETDALPGSSADYQHDLDARRCHGGGRRRRLDLRQRDLGEDWLPHAVVGCVVDDLAAQLLGGVHHQRTSKVAGQVLDPWRGANHAEDVGLLGPVEAELRLVLLGHA